MSSYASHPAGTLPLSSHTPSEVRSCFEVFRAIQASRVPNYPVIRILTCVPERGRSFSCGLASRTHMPLFILHTGKSAFLRPPPALSRTCCMYGPITGMLAVNPPIVEKKSPNNTKIPYSSIRKPTTGHRSNINMIPAANAAVPFSFCRRAKKTVVFCSPIMRVRPKRKRI